MILKTKPLLAVNAVDTFAIDVKVGDYIPDSFEPKDFSKAWRVTKVNGNFRFPFRKLTLQRDKMVIEHTLPNEDKVSVFPKPKQTKRLRSINNIDIVKTILWAYFIVTVAIVAFTGGRY